MLQDLVIEDGVPYGRRLFHQLLDEIAGRTPDRIYAQVAKSRDLDEGFHEYTFKQLAQAVDATAWWLAENIGTSETFEPFAYMVLPVRNFTVVVVLIRKLGSE